MIASRISTVVCRSADRGSSCPLAFKDAHGVSVQDVAALGDWRRAAQMLGYVGEDDQINLS